MRTLTEFLEDSMMVEGEEYFMKVRGKQGNGLLGADGKSPRKTHAYHMTQTADGRKGANVHKHPETGKWYAAGGSSSAVRKTTTFHNTPEEAATAYHAKYKQKVTFHRVDEEQIEELSKDTMRSYVDKASASDPKDERQYKTRSKGLETAQKKIDEMLAELSKKTLSNYIKAAGEDRIMHTSGDSFASGAKGDAYNKAPETHKDNMRKKGIDTALNKLVK